jgi:multicomponent Na+:H+ antiporter subunit C
MNAFPYMLAGVGLVLIGLLGIMLIAHLVRKVLALNVMGTGVFMLFVSLACPPEQSGAAATLADPVPHALVLTGLVVAVSATALTLALTVRYQEQTGRTSLPEELADSSSAC